MWYWHALEETEHKAVAFDVWNAVIKPGPKRYLLRTGTMLTTTVFFWLAFLNTGTELFIQGWYFSKALPGDQLERFVRERAALAEA